MPLKRAYHAQKSSATQSVYVKRAYPQHSHMEFPGKTTQKEEA